MNDLVFYLDSTRLLLLFASPMQIPSGSILANAVHCTCTPGPNHGSLLRATWQCTEIYGRIHGSFYATSQTVYASDEGSSSSSIDHIFICSSLIFTSHGREILISKQEEIQDISTSKAKPHYWVQATSKRFRKVIMVHESYQSAPCNACVDRSVLKTDSDEGAVLLTVKPAPHERLDRVRDLRDRRVSRVRLSELSLLRV